MGINCDDGFNDLPDGSDASEYIISCDVCGTGDQLGPPDFTLLISAWAGGLAFPTHASLEAALLRSGWINDGGNCWICPTCQKQEVKQ